MSGKGTLPRAKRPKLAKRVGYFGVKTACGRGLALGMGGRLRPGGIERGSLRGVVRRG